MRNCLLTLRTLPKDLKRQVPAFVALPRTHVSIINCDFIGGTGQNLTSALVFMYPATVIISICRFSRFRGGAVYSVCQAKDVVRGIKGSEFLMQDCKIEDGAITGIYCAGPGAKQVLLRNKLQNIRGIGIRIHKGNKSKVKGCEIKKCITGIEVLSGDPMVLFCSIKNCWENGILTIAKEGIRCDGLIKMSWIRQCRDNGILCAGFNNHTRIEKCHEIQSNRLVGIKAVEQASIVIFGNKIFGNFQQGILLTDGTSAHIE